MIVTEEFIKHFNICNDFQFAGKEEFYQMKDLFLKEYSSFIGYDLQFWNRWTVYDYHIGEIWTFDTKTAKKGYLNGRWNEPRWDSRHLHILERYEITFLKEKMIKVRNTDFYKKETVKEKALFHIPTNEFKFQCTKYEKQSDNYSKLRKQIMDKIPGRKVQKLKRKPPFPAESLTWLKEYMRTNNICKKQLELSFEDEV